MAWIEQPDMYRLTDTHMVGFMFTVPLVTSHMHHLTGSLPMDPELELGTETSMQATSPMELQCLR